MKSLKKAILLASFAGGLVVSAGAQSADSPTIQEPPRNEQPGQPGQPGGGENGPGGGGPGGPSEQGEPMGGEMAGLDGEQEGGTETSSSVKKGNTTARTSVIPKGTVIGREKMGNTNGISITNGTNFVVVNGTNITTGVSNSIATFGDKGLCPNLRGAPIEMVLNYMSDAAGFVIVLETDVRGTVDLWSKTPLSKDETVALLNSVLYKNGYAAIQNGRILTIVTREEARRRDIPIKSGNNPKDIPKDAEVVTQVIPVRSLNASQLKTDLAPLLPSDTSITANEAGNSLVMTDTQANIHRVAELITALDAASSGANSIKVFALQYADSKSLVTIIKELFPSSGSSSSGQSGSFGRMNPMMMFGGPGSRGNRSSTSDSSEKASTRISAVSDDTSNTVVVSAPDDILMVISNLVVTLDVPTEDQTLVRLFTLKSADPTEMAELLTSLFPDDTSSSSSSGNRGGFGFFGGPPGMNRRNSSSTDTSNRLLKKNKVIAVADARTSSVVVSADKSLMESIAQMIEKLDSNPARKQKVYVYSLQNANVRDVLYVLEDMFQTSNSRTTTSTATSQTTDPLVTRSTQLQSESTSTSSFGSSNSSN